MTDPLAPFWKLPIVVYRKTSDGASGPIFAAADSTLKGRVKNARKLVRTADGEEVISEAAVSLPFVTPTIPVGSRVTLPDSRTAFVLVEDRHDSGLDFMPNYYSIDLT